MILYSLKVNSVSTKSIGWHQLDKRFMRSTHWVIDPAISRCEW